MSLVYRTLLSALWLSWAVYWLARSRDVKRTVRREPLVSRLLHVVPLILALLLVAAPSIPGWVLCERVLPLAAWPFWVGAVLTAGGLLFAVWARMHLGTNWSGTVTLKQDHELVTTGPYAIVRHPIYTGLLLALAGSALARGELRGLLAVGIAMLALWRKLRLEERWMREQFGEDYDAYRRRVSALIPFVRCAAPRSKSTP
jgi:protein-S-isoprenylcysteine O-methyltransferase Ste14